MKFGDVNVFVVEGSLAAEEIQKYISYIRENNPGRTLRDLELRVDGEEIEMKYTLAALAFEHIRRITGYLVGTTERWNNAKRAEEKDRVKHCCS